MLAYRVGRGSDGKTKHIYQVLPQPVPDSALQEWNRIAPAGVTYVPWGEPGKPKQREPAKPAKPEEQEEDIDDLIADLGDLVPEPAKPEEPPSLNHLFDGTEK